MRRTRLLGLGFATAILCSLATASVSASPQPTPPAGSLRIDTSSASWETDPGTAYVSGAWQLQYASCAKLVNYPDAPHPEGSLLMPEIATAMPTISADGRTYTFQIRNDFAFSPPASGVVTPQSMKWTFERVAHPDMASAGYQFMTNIVGAEEFNSGQAGEITGIVAQGNTLTITLIEPQGDFLSIIAMPFFCAIPTTMPPVEQFAPIPSAGPYYVSAFTINERLTVLRNPNYDGPRPQTFDSFEYYFAQPEADIRQRVESGVSDYGMSVGPWEELRQLYGPDSPAAAHGLQQWFANPSSCVGFIPLNTERQLFADVNMRKAVNYALDRAALSALLFPGQAPIHDQYLPPLIPGYEDIAAYPSTPDLVLARQLADWQPGDPMRPYVMYYRTTPASNQLQAFAVRDQLREIGLEATMVGFSGGQIFTRMGHRGEPFDLGVSVGWCEDWHDPWSHIRQFDGTTIQAENNINFAYFNDPVFNARMHAAVELVGEARYDAFRDIEHDLVRDAAPWAAWRLYSTSDFFSKRIGCHRWQPAYWSMSLTALCVRPEIRTDDSSVVEPATGTTTMPITVRLSSEMDNSVSIGYSTQDGTAHAGEDYVATSGTLTFAPNQRVKTVDVTINADTVAEPAETFTLNLSNESSGTIVDSQAVATILDRPVGPPPPNPPPPMPPPPPFPPPPPWGGPPARCRVPRVIGMPLARARTRLRRSHCSTGRVRRVRSRRALRGRVVSQSPRPGFVRRRGFPVTLRVGR